MKKILIIIPTYNEKESIVILLNKIKEEVEGLGENIFVRVVDDNSPDSTSDVVKKLNYSFVSVYDRSQKNGLGAAYIDTFERTLSNGEEFDYLMTMDADGSHRVEDLKKIINEINSKSPDLVIGSRYIKGGDCENWPWKRKALSRAGSLYAHLAIKLPFADCTGGFRAYRVDNLRKINLGKIDSKGYGFQIEMGLASYTSSNSYLEVPIIFVERIHGYSKMSGNIVSEALKNLTDIGWQMRKNKSYLKETYLK
jgi:dolichol-phosphate mannosyltransferase